MKLLAVLIWLVSSLAHASAPSLCMAALGETGGLETQFMRLVEYGLNQRALDAEDLRVVANSEEPVSPMATKAKTSASAALASGFETVISAIANDELTWSNITESLHERVNYLEEEDELREDKSKRSAAISRIRELTITYPGYHFNRSDLFQTPNGRVLVVGSLTANQGTRFAIWAPYESNTPIFDEPTVFTSSALRLEVTWHMTPKGRLLAVTRDYQGMIRVLEPLVSKNPLFEFQQGFEHQANFVWHSTKAGETYLAFEEAGSILVFKPLKSKKPVWKSAELGNEHLSHWVDAGKGKLLLVTEDQDYRGKSKSIFEIGKPEMIWGVNYKGTMPMSFHFGKDGGQLLAIANGNTVRILDAHKNYEQIWDAKFRHAPNYDYDVEWIQMKNGRRLLMVWQGSCHISLFDPLLPKNATKPIWRMGSECDRDGIFGQPSWFETESGKLMIAFRHNDGKNPVRTMMVEPLGPKENVWTAEDSHPGSVVWPVRFLPVQYESDVSVLAITGDSIPFQRFSLWTPANGPAAAEHGRPFEVGGNDDKELPALVLRPGVILTSRFKDGQTLILSEVSREKGGRK